MLTPGKRTKLHNAIKAYNKKYLHGKLTDLDESGTRLMINTFLTDVLGYAPITEVKTEYMIRGTYADYVIQLKDQRHFLVEVKALSFALSDKHLRQAINYGANEGIEWALLTNGKSFDFYRILFNKPIESRKVFSIDLSDAIQMKHSGEIMQFLHKDSVGNKGLDFLWNKTVALDPNCVAGLLYSPVVINYIRRTLKSKYKSKFSEAEVMRSLNRVLVEAIDPANIKVAKVKKERNKKSATPVAEHGVLDGGADAPSLN